MSCYISFYVSKENFFITDENEKQIMNDSILIRSINQKSEIGNTIANNFKYDQLVVLNVDKIKDIKNEINKYKRISEIKIEQINKITINTVSDYEAYIAAKEEYVEELYYLVELIGFFDMLEEMILYEKYNIYVIVG